METERMDSVSTIDVIAVALPARGHINPFLFFCKRLALTQPTVIIRFVVTEEWRDLLSSESLPENFHLDAIPNVLPLERVRAKDLVGFGQAVMTKMEPEVDRLLDQIKMSDHRIILSDSDLYWAINIGKPRNIPVAYFWTTPATRFCNWHEYLIRKDDPQFSESSEAKDLLLGLGSHPGQRHYKDQDMINFALVIVANIMHSAKYLLFTSVYELESKAIDDLKAKFPIPIYSIGPAIPYFECEKDSGQISSHENNGQNYFEWLDAQPKGSVLYISQGSFGSVSKEQLDEIVAAVIDSGVRYLWVVRHDLAISLPQGSENSKGLTVPWCDQLKVLCHPSIGGFWTHCGWNSIKEALFAGVPMLTFPIMWDQAPNSKKIVEDWKVGWEVGKCNHDWVVSRTGISTILKSFMDQENDEVKEMRKRAQQMREICLRSTSEGGSADLAIQDFIKDILA